MYPGADVIRSIQRDGNGTKSYVFEKAVCYNERQLEAVDEDIFIVQRL